jgi:uncharacterized protein YjbI with pentapeptide repeats
MDCIRIGEIGMVNKIHALHLLQAVASNNCRVWNDWRIEHPTLLPQLSTFELCHANLSFINLSRSDLKMADFSEADFYRADLESSDLRMAILENANLRKANLQNSNLCRANLKGADLREADLRCADLRGADLTGALLEKAYLTNAVYDPDAVREIINIRGGCVSRLEKIALRIIRYGKPKRVPPASSRLSGRLHFYPDFDR